MGYKKPFGYKTPHEIIKSTSGVNRSEILFIKDKGPFKKLIQNSKPLHSNKVANDYFITNFNNKKTLHNHIYSAKKYLVPSIEDLSVSFFNHYRFKESNLNTISLMKNGTEVGRTHYMLTEKTFKMVDSIFKKNKNDLGKFKFGITNYFFDIILESGKFSSPDLFYNQIKKNKSLFTLYHKLYFFHELINDYKIKNRIPTVKERKELINKLTNDIGIKFRFVPMPGYLFNKEKFVFEKIK